MKIIYLSLILLFGCGVEEISVQDASCKQIEIVSTITGKEKIGLATIQSAVVVGNSLNVTFNYGGGCDPNHNFQIFATQGTDSKSLNAVFAFNTTDACKRLDTKTFCFDITNLKKSYTSIKINGLKDAIVF